MKKDLFGDRMKNSLCCTIKLHENKTLSFQKRNNDKRLYVVVAYDDSGNIVMQKTCNHSQVITFPDIATLSRVFGYQNMTIEYGHQPTEFTVMPSRIDIQTSYDKLRNKISIL